MICGQLERVSTEILRPGVMRPIHAGDRLIHQLFHLELPSVTIVIRTYGERPHLPQYRYLPPGLAIDREDSDELRTRRLILLDGMARGHIDGLWKYTCNLIESGNLETLFYIFSTLTRRKIDRGLLMELYSVARQRHGDIVDLFQRVCEEERRTRIVTALRSKVSDPEARFLLALLMLMPDRNAIFETIRLQLPNAEPLSMIETWLEGMSGKETIGFDFSDVNRLIFRSLVEGLDTEGLLQRLRTEFRDDSIDAHRDRLLDHAKQLARSDLFFLYSPILLSERRLGLHEPFGLRFWIGTGVLLIKAFHSYRQGLRRQSQFHSLIPPRDFGVLTFLGTIGWVPLESRLQLRKLNISCSKGLAAARQGCFDEALLLA